MALNFKLRLFRHANAVKAASPGHNEDMLRPLSSKGIEQARQRAHQLGTIYGPRKDAFVVASPAERTLMTAEIVTGVPRSEIRAVQAFCFEPAIASDDWAAFDAAFNRHSYAPLQTYLDDVEAREPMLRIGLKMVSSLVEIAEEIGEDEQVSIFTHAVMGVVVTFILLADNNEELAKKVAAISLSEAGGYTVVFKDGHIVAVDELPALEEVTA